MTTKDQWRASIRPRIEMAQQTLKEIPPEFLAKYSGGKLRNGSIQLSLFAETLNISIPEFVAQSSTGAICREETQLLILDYLTCCSNLSILPITKQEWIGFQELPNGAFYVKAFRSYTSDLIMGRLDGDTDRFVRACTRLGGKPFSLGDAAFRFQALPILRLAVVWWAGDDEFAAHANVLFDRAAAATLPIDGMATLGRLLCRKFLATVDEEAQASRRTIDASQSTRSHHVEDHS